MQTSTSLRRAARSLGLVTVGVLSTLGALSLSHVGPVQAQTPGVNLAQLVAQVNALQSKLTTDEQTIAAQGNTITAQASQIAALQTKTAPLSVSGKDLTFTGVNVHIVDGTGSTSSTSGLGNLIIGYNAAGNDQGKGDVRTGSHNLILGDQSNYSSYGGLIAGQDNAISAAFASVSGGNGNTASNYYASVSGGNGNTASNYYASVSGGNGNTASGYSASVSGGIYNKASNLYASVSGGNQVTQNSLAGWSGGSYHTP